MKHMNSVFTEPTAIACPYFLTSLCWSQSSRPVGSAVAAAPCRHAPRPSGLPAQLSLCFGPTDTPGFLQNVHNFRLLKVGLLIFSVKFFFCYCFSTKRLGFTKLCDVAFITHW